MTLIIDDNVDKAVPQLILDLSTYHGNVEE